MRGAVGVARFTSLLFVRCCCDRSFHIAFAGCICCLLYFALLGAGVVESLVSLRLGCCLMYCVFVVYILYARGAVVARFTSLLFVRCCCGRSFHVAWDVA